MSWIPAARGMRAAFVAAVLLISTTSTGVSRAAEKTPVGFAGIAYSGAAAESKARLPHVAAVLGQVGDTAYSQMLARAFEARPPRHIELTPASDLQRLDGVGSAVVMAIALDRETVTSERIDGRHKVLFEIAAQALFFDFREKQVLFAYPITLQYIDRFDHEPTPAQLQAMAARLLTGDGSSGLLTVAPTELEALQLPNASSRRMQVTHVELTELARGKLPTQQQDTALIGNEFTKILASTLRLPMLPHASGQAIGGAMSTRFADGTVYQLRIPEPDYRITLEVDDFRDKTLGVNGGFRQQLYGAFFKVRVEEPMSSRAYLDQPLRQGSTKAIPDSQDVVDSAAAYYETLLAGFASLAQAGGGGAKDWAAEQTGGREFTTQLKAFRELIQQCR